jgi:hypothetical protein
MYLTLTEVKELIDQLAEKINAPQNSLPTYGYSEQSGRWEVIVDAEGYQLVAFERGKELERYITSDIDELLYKIFDGVTFWLACKYELAHRIEEQDCRRMIFQHQVELLSMLSPQWSIREIQEHNQTLMEYPFDDFAGIRASLCGRLREQGYSEDAIDKLAYEKYPLPKESLEK